MNAAEFMILPLEKEQYGILPDFLYEAIFVPPGVPAPPRDIIERDELQTYIKDFGGSHDYALTAQIDGKIIGAVWARIMNDYGHIDDETPSLALAVLKPYRGRGIGTALTARMLSLLAQNGYKSVSLSVQKANYAVGLYRKLGFETYEDRGEELLMRRVLG